MERSGAHSKRLLLRQIPLFSTLTDAQLDFIASRSRLTEFEKGEVIYSKGDPPDAFYGLISGRVQVSTLDTAGKPEIIEVLHRGDHFGTVSLLTNEPHSVTTRVLNDSILLKIKQEAFDAILKEVPEVAIQLSASLSRRLRQRDFPSKQVFESTLVSIYSPLHGTGQTTYAINLAASLGKETGKRVLIVGISPAGDSIAQALGIEASSAPMRLKGVSFDQSRIDSSILKHPNLLFDSLSIAHDPRVATDVPQVSPLLSYLANLYHYVVVDLPHVMDRTVFKALIQADWIHLVSHPTYEHLHATAQFIQELMKTVQQAGERVKVVVHETSQEVNASEWPLILEQKVYATLPAVTALPAPGHPVVLAHPDWEYSKAVRRVSREIGEVLVGLVLGSGAAMGLSHIGVLRVLEREQIPIDIVAGSSIGALIGAFWTSGVDSKGMEDIASDFRSKGSLLKLIDLTVPKFGIFTGRRVTKLLANQLGDITFRDLKIPLKVTACDYARRELIILDEGSVIQAIRASVSIPAIFEPIKVHGHWLIDGGVLDPVPVDVLTQMGVHKVIAVNTLPSPADIQKRQQELVEEFHRLKQEAFSKGWLSALKFKLKSAWWNWRDPNILDVIMHTMQGMEYVLAEMGCAQADVALHPTIPRVNWWEFYNVDQLIRRGEEETLKHLPAIKKLVSE